MNLFDQLTMEAIKAQPHLSSLRVVVEKELLHHDILRISAAAFLKDYKDRQSILANDGSSYPEFEHEMKRFLAPDQIQKMIKQEHFWSFVVTHMDNLGKKIHDSLSSV